MVIFRLLGLILLCEQDNIMLWSVNVDIAYAYEGCKSLRSYSG